MEITKELIEQAKKDIITSVEDGRMRINSQRLLFKLLTKAMNYIPCCETLLDCFKAKEPVTYKDQKYYLTKLEIMNNGDEFCDLMNIETYETLDNINGKELKI